MPAADTPREGNSSTLLPAEHTGIIQPKGFPGLPEGWVSEWETLPSSEGKHQVFVMTHSKKGSVSPRALFVVHGFGEHGGRYLHVPHYVQNHFERVICPDLIGHGRSEGLRGHVENFDAMVEDTVKQIRLWHARLKALGQGEPEIHGLFHSMGGLVGLRALLMHSDVPLRSATVSAPFLGIKAKVPLAKKIAALVLSRFLGSLQMATGLDASVISHDPEVVKAYRTDRLVHGKMTPQFFMELQRVHSDTMSRDSGIRVPIQFLVPLQDQLVDEKKTLLFAERLKFKEKRIRTYSKFFHESLNEVDKETAFEDLLSWVKMHS